MTSVIRNLLSLTASAAALAVAAGAAQASSFAIRAGQSAEGLGMAFAGAASGGIGLGAMAWNPAAITMFPGRQSQWNATYLNASAKYRLDGVNSFAAFGGSDNLGINGAFIPASYNAWQITDRLFIGLTNTAPFGLRSKPGGNDGLFAGSAYGNSATVRTVNVAPTIGYALNDWISVGAALQIQYLQVDFKQSLGLANGPRLQVRGDAYDIGYRVGVTLTPFKGTNIGLAYRSGFETKVKGFAQGPTGRFSTNVNVPLPGSMVLGVSQVINDRWQGHLGVEWTNWKVFKNLNVMRNDTGAALAIGGNPVVSRFNYKDSWFFSGGVEYKYSDALTLRGGVGYELSAVSDATRGVLISDNDRLWLSTGFSYKASEKLSLDVGYTFINVNKSRVAINAGQQSFLPGNNFNAVAEPKIHVVSAGLTYRWDDPTVAQSVVSKSAPISVRY